MMSEHMSLDVNHTCGEISSYKVHKFSHAKIVSGAHSLGTIGGICLCGFAYR